MTKVCEMFPTDNWLRQFIREMNTYEFTLATQCMDDIVKRATIVHFPQDSTHLNAFILKCPVDAVMRTYFTIQQQCCFVKWVERRYIFLEGLGIYAV